MASKANWQKMNIEQRIRAVHIDIMRHPEFALLSGVVCMGNVIIDDAFCPTAATDGLNVYYNSQFMAAQSVEQVRWVVLHENFHKALKHCTEYKHIIEKFRGPICNIAMDFVVNLLIYDMDTNESFAKRPTNVKPCFDEQYRGMSFVEVLKKLLENAKQISVGGGEGDGEGGGGGAGGDQPFDTHVQGKHAYEKAKQIGKDMEEAVQHGKRIVERLAGKGRGGQALDRSMQKRRTEWREHFQDFFFSIVSGDDYSRFCPPNRRMLPLGFVMPSHFSEAMDEIILAADTSGSMYGIYPVLFGEVARICETVKPAKLRVIWWDGEVNSEQVFTPDNYDQIAGLLKPEGGGGTSPNCVVRYIAEKQYKPKAVVWLTDGYLDGSDTATGCEQLWGVIDNKNFTSAQGRVVHIDSMNH